MDLTEKRNQLNEYSEKLGIALNRANELREKGVDKLTEDEDLEADRLVREINALGTSIFALDAELRSRQPAGAVANAAAGSTVADTEGKTDPVWKRMAEDTKGLRSVESRAMERLTFDVDGGSFFNQRAIVNTPLLPSEYVQPQFETTFRRYDPPFDSLRDVLQVGQTNADTLVYFRETAFTNNAAEVGEATATTGSTGLKPESAFTFDQQTSTVATIAHWVPITKQTLWNAPELRSYIEGRLIDGLKYREDAELLNGNGTAPNLRGIMNTSNVQTLDATYFGANPVADEGTSNELFNRLLRARTLVQTVGRRTANFAVLNPLDLEVLMSTTDGQRQYFGAGPFAAGNVTTIWGMRVVSNENLAAGTALVGDGREATIWDRMAATVSAGWINDQFVRNMLTLLAEERVGLTVFRPQAFAKVTLAITETP